MACKSKLTSAGGPPKHIHVPNVKRVPQDCGSSLERQTKQKWSQWVTLLNATSRKNDAVAV